MKYSTVLSFATLALGVIAEPTQVKREPTLVERDLATITGVLATIGQKVTALDTAVKSFSGASDIPGLTAANSAVLSAITDGNTKVSGTSTITTIEALDLQTAVQALTSQVNTVVTDIISKKSTITSAGVAGTVLKGLQDQKTASGTLATTISGKVPSALSSLAQTLSAGITDDLQKGVTAYQGSTDSGSASGGASSAPVSAPAPSSSTAPSSSAAAPEPSSTESAASVPTTSVAVIAPASTPTPTPAQYDGAASISGVHGAVGVIAVAAAALML